MSEDDAFREPFLPLFEGQEFVATDPKGRRLPSYIRDHRRRLRDRFLEGGAAAMPDYELLELLLFRALPRCDVKPVAGGASLVTFAKVGGRGQRSSPAERPEERRLAM